MLLVLCSIIIHSCEKEEETAMMHRLFQPVLKEDLYSRGNSIIVDFEKMKNTSGYLIEVSRDSFETTLYSFQVDTNYVEINKDLTGEDLLWFTIYQVQATSISDDPQYNSYASLLGSVRTQKFPSNMVPPTQFDVLDTRARVNWIPSGAAITKVEVFAADDERLANPLSEFDVTSDDNGSKIVSGLDPSTTYQIAIYSGSDIRGWEAYTTREPLVSGDNVIDLTGNSGEVDLADALSGATDGGFVILEGGKTYLAGGYQFDKSLTFMSGYSFTPALPIIDCSSNFNIVDGSNIGQILFKEIEFTAPLGFDSKMLMNIDQNGTIDEIKFESCHIHHLYGIARLAAGTGTLNKFTVTDCIIDSINGYGVFTGDIATWACNDIVVENSTISRAIRFISLKSNVNSILVDGCSANECPKNGSILFYGNSGISANNIQVNNSIWGHAWDVTGGENYALLGIQYQVTSAYWNAANTWVTGDLSLQYATLGIPGMPGPVYSGAANDLWVDPVNNDFNFKDTGFAGKGDSGDPRWRIGL